VEKEWSPENKIGTASGRRKKYSNSKSSIGGVSMLSKKGGREKKAASKRALKKGVIATRTE